MKKLADFKIPFNKPPLTGKELEYIKQAHEIGQFSGDGFFTKKCNQWIENNIGARKSLLTHSCTAALEMMAILADLRLGDEVIMPSYTFVSTANAFVMRGAVPVFVDIREDTLNINEKLIESAITPNTKAIVVVHYAGVGCEMDEILKIAKKYNLLIFEDAAQGILAKYKDKYLGAIGDLGAFSFHETKNIASGEGGAILINNPKYSERAEIIREKGTNRNQFFRGQVDKYTWVDIGSSYLPGEIIAAFLAAQLEEAQNLTRKRVEIWNNYHRQLAELEKCGYLRRPIVPDNCEHNGHMYYVLLDDLERRTKLIDFLKQQDILSVFHYIPLHSSPAGRKFGRAIGDMKITDSTTDRLLRLPLFYELSNRDIEFVIGSIKNFYIKF